MSKDCSICFELVELKDQIKLDCNANQTIIIDRKCLEKLQCVEPSEHQKIVVCPFCTKEIVVNYANKVINTFNFGNVTKMICDMIFCIAISTIFLSNYFEFVRALAINVYITLISYCCCYTKLFMFYKVVNQPIYIKTHIVKCSHYVAGAPGYLR